MSLGRGFSSLEEGSTAASLSTGGAGAVGPLSPGTVDMASGGGTGYWRVALVAKHCLGTLV